MTEKGNIHKMKVELTSTVQYFMNLEGASVIMNDLVGANIKLSFNNRINCVNCGKQTPKSFAQGFCYPCFAKSAENSDCILRPELCRGHLGEGRDAIWEQENHVQPHYVYLAQSSSTKVGVTRSTQVPTRWIDQGATLATIIAETPNRYLAGCIEVALKDLFTDKTDWRKMLRGPAEHLNLTDLKEKLFKEVSEEIKMYQFSLLTEPESTFTYPVTLYPEKVSSIGLDKTPIIESKLLGIKGQYLIFEAGVFNVRSHTGYEITIEGNDAT
jgi:hypothetical protein